MNPTRKQVILDVILLFVLALGARFTLAVCLPSYDSIFWDQPYKIYAENFAEGRGFWMPNPYSANIGMDKAYAFRSPLFPFLWGCVYNITHGSYVPIRIAFAFLSSITVVLAYFIGRELTGKRNVALLAGIGCALYPPLIWHSIHLMTEPLFIFFQTLAILSLLRVRATGRWKWVIAAGAATGLGILSRSVLIGFAPFMALWILWVGGWKKRGLPQAAGFTAVVLLVMSPWIMRNYHIFHRFVPTTTDAGHGFYVANNPNTLNDPRGFWIPEDWSFILKPGEQTIDEVEANRRLVAMARGYLLSHPADAAKLMARRFVTLWRFWPNPEFVGKTEVLVYALSYVPLFPFILIGLWLAHKRLRDRMQDLLLVDALIIYTTAIHVAILAMMRYRVPLMPYLIIYAALAVVVIWGKLMVAQTDRTD